MTWTMTAAADRAGGLCRRFRLGGHPRAWYEAIGSSLPPRIDGLSLTMVLLTTLLTPLAILASFGIDDRVKPYMILFLFLETGMLGVFLALDLLLFFVFWEIGLVPMYFLINQWGSAAKWGGRSTPRSSS
jgi:NADH:ubiquinone oxidoreductase subunit 4 (subunit M)